MTGPRFAILFGVLIIQRAAGQNAQCQCQSDLFISMEDLMRALGKNGNQQGVSICEESRECSEPSITVTTEKSCYQPSISLSQQSCGCEQQQPSVTFATQPSICNKPSFSFGQNSCGCQPSISIPNKPSFSFGQQSCGIQQQPSFEINQPSISFPGKSCGCQPSFSIGNKPSFSIGQSLCGCETQQRPSFAFESQPSVSIVQQPCGFEIQQQPSFTIERQPSISIGQQSCGYGIQQQPSLAFPQPSISIGQQYGCGNQQMLKQPTLPRLQLPQQCGGNQQSFSINQPTFANIQQQISDASKCVVSELEIPSQTINVGGSFDISNIGNNVGNIIPNALLQAPPFGVYFEGENLLIDGVVQVCGSMPFSSIVEVSGRVPASGSGCVQYECNDYCECKNKN